MEGGGFSGSSTTSSCLMASFGDNYNINNNNNNSNYSCSSNGGGVYSSYPMMMMMPFMTSSSSSSSSLNADHHQHHHPNNSHLYPSLSSPSNTITHHHHHHQQHHHHCFNPTSTAATTTTAPPPGSSLMLHQHQQEEQRHLSTNNNSNPNNNTCYFMESSSNNNDGSSSNSAKSKIMAHPHYNRLLSAYLNCQKVGAPAEVVAKLEEACGAQAAAAASMVTAMGGSTTTTTGGGGGGGGIGEDPALDQFMEAYCEMLTKYHHELSKPFNEAMVFLSRIESQFKSLSLDPPPDLSVCQEIMDRTGSSEEDVDVNSVVDPQAQDKDLKVQLLRKYSGYLGSLKQEFMKKRKKGKLPKEARQMLMDWWSRHYKWPYPSESQKMALAEATGLDQKQINNWFINQRKRHWKPSEDMQFVIMDGAHPHYCMDHVLNQPFSMDYSSSFL